jgi:hypothetical protein
LVPRAGGALALVAVTASLVAVMVASSVRGSRGFELIHEGPPPRAARPAR